MNRPISLTSQAMDQITVTAPRRGLCNITEPVTAWLKEHQVNTGLLTLFLRHTSASLVIQENADPNVLRDMEDFFLALVPEDPSLYRHNQEGPDDMPAHIKGALTQTHLAIPVSDGNLMLGTWQGIFLFEHRDRTPPRNIVLHFQGH